MIYIYTLYIMYIVMGTFENNIYRIHINISLLYVLR